MTRTKAVQRTLKVLRDGGWQAAIVERYVKAPNMPFGRRFDVWGFGDILASRTASNGFRAAIALVQCCPGSTHAEHKDKILAIPEFEEWKKANGIVFLVSWRKSKKYGWVMRREVL